MRQIAPQIVLVQKILGQQRMDEDALYRLTTHCMRVEQPEGVLLYHTLTGELLLLSLAEAALLEGLPGPVPPALAELVRRRFLVPECTDDIALADQVREIAVHLTKKEPAITKYKIFTTTDCNARCFYCFEAGIKRIAMSEQTARDTASYIAKHCGGKPVRLSWFGGEPLANVHAIDVITDYLRQQGVKFHSTMTTNGYLLDEVLAQRAHDVWCLKEVQITLDGTEEVYNRRKAYVNPQGSPYRRVLRNIGLLLDAGISVNARLLMDRDNEQDLYALVDELKALFGGKSGFGAYPAIPFENAGTKPESYTEETRSFYAEKLLALQNYIESKGIERQVSLKHELLVNSCAAEDGRFTTVTPEGRLCRCAGDTDGSIWGSIYSDAVDEEVLRQWRERKPLEEACKTCFAYPQCMLLKKCPSWPEHCSPILRANREFRRRQGILKAYEDWKTAGQN